MITRKPADQLISALRGKGYSVTVVDGQGRDGEVGILFLVLKRKSLENAVALVKEYNPKAFYTVEDMRFVREPQLMVPGTTKRWRKTRGR